MPQIKESQSHPREVRDTVCHVYKGNEPPSIPSKKASFGYNIDEKRRLVRRVPETTKKEFSGERNDLVGPGEYNPQVKAIVN